MAARIIENLQGVPPQVLAYFTMLTYRLICDQKGKNKLSSGFTSSSFLNPSPRDIGPRGDIRVGSYRNRLLGRKRCVHTRNTYARIIIIRCSYRHSFCTYSDFPCTN